MIKLLVFVYNKTIKSISLFFYFLFKVQVKYRLFFFVENLTKVIFLVYKNLSLVGL